MRYSIRDEDTNIILTIEDEVTDRIEQLCNDYAEKITEWGKKFNSKLVYDICKKTIGMIDEDYTESMRNFVSHYDETGISFINISKRYHVGEEALAKAGEFQNKILEKVVSHNVNEIEYICDGEAKYSTELINEYKDIINSFLSGIEEANDIHYDDVRKVYSENLLGAGIDILVKYQFETLHKICLLYDRIFQSFLEWYERTLRENQALLEELNQQVVNASNEIKDDRVEKLLSQILESDSGLTDNSQSGSIGGNADKITGDNKTVSEEKSKEKNREKVKQAAKKAVSDSVDSLLKELDSPEKIKGFKQYYQECQKGFDEYKNEKDKDTKKSKFKKLCDCIKSGAKKYGKAIMKALGIVVPLIAPEGHIVGKIAKNLPNIIKCFTGAENKEKDAGKIELGLECMKSIGLDKFPESQEEVKEHFKKYGESIANDILKKILSSEKYMKVLDIDEEELSIPENKKLYKSITGKDVKAVPQKRKAYNYDFEQYNPKALRSIAPTESEEKANKIAEDVYSAVSTYDNDTFEHISSGLNHVKTQLKSGKGYIQIPDNEEISKLIEELRGIVNGHLKEEILPSIDGRYNKEDMRMLCEEFEYERNKAGENNSKPDYSRACRNFIRRQMGYPAEDDTVIVKDIQELIPVINKRCARFSIDNKELVKEINNAQNLFNSKNSNIKRKGILNSLFVNMAAFGSYLGIAASFIMGALWPLGVVLTTAPVCAALYNDDAGSYAYLVSNLGDERTEFLMKNYQNVDENCFQFSEKKNPTSSFEH